MGTDNYIIRGGVEGRERLRVLSRVLQPTTAALFDRAGVASGMTVLDVGCGGGDVTIELARRVGSGGRVVGVDLDATKLELARAEADDRRLGNVEFRAANANDSLGDSEYDVVYARFLLTHVDAPDDVLARMMSALKPGGLVVVEDTDFSGHFSFPQSEAFQQYQALYGESVRRRGGDPDIGQRLPLLLVAAGFADVEMNVVQHANTNGDAKLVTPITMENIADALVGDGLADKEEVDRIVSELYAFAERADTVMSMPRIVQAWGMRPAA